MKATNVVHMCNDKTDSPSIARTSMWGRLAFCDSLSSSLFPDSGVSLFATLPWETHTHTEFFFLSEHFFSSNSLPLTYIKIF